MKKFGNLGIFLIDVISREESQYCLTNVRVRTALKKRLKVAIENDSVDAFKCFLDTEKAQHVPCDDDDRREWHGSRALVLPLAFKTDDLIAKYNLFYVAAVASATQIILYIFSEFPKVAAALAGHADYKNIYKFDGKHPDEVESPSRDLLRDLKTRNTLSVYNTRVAKIKNIGIYTNLRSAVLERGGQPTQDWINEVRLRILKGNESSRGQFAITSTKKGVSKFFYKDSTLNWIRIQNAKEAGNLVTVATRPLFSDDSEFARVIKIAILQQEGMLPPSPMLPAPSSMAFCLTSKTRVLFRGSVLSNVYMKELFTVATTDLPREMRNKAGAAAAMTASEVARSWGGFVRNRLLRKKGEFVSFNAFKDEFERYAGRPGSLRQRSGGLKHLQMKLKTSKSLPSLSEIEVLAEPRVRLKRS